MSPSTRPIPIVACLAGDGIGPEVMAEAGRVIDAASELFGIRVRQVHLPFGGDAIDKHGDPFPSHVRAAVKASDALRTGAYTKTLTTMTQSRNAVPQRGWMSEYRCAISGVSSSPAS